MKATVLVDNISKDSLKGEWGLCIYIEYGGKRILLDTGAGKLFGINAEKLGINLAKVDYGVLSHAHYDHADGLPYFFEINKKAKFYLRDTCKENCYGKRWIFSKYIGIKKGVLSDYSDRLEYVKGSKVLFPGCTLLGHNTNGLSEFGLKAGLYRKDGKGMTPDDFNHEQSLIIKTEKGLVIFNSCSHGGADNIITEVSNAFPGAEIYALIGGLHLYKSKEDEVIALANRVKKTGIKKIYTGHCTGDKALAILRRELGEDTLITLHTGLVIEA